ncbi:MAG TPA: transglycosylase SLT domain-containing protein [Chitinophaga sp.]
MIRYLILLLCLYVNTVKAQQQLDFCGEAVPMERDFVSYRLMDVIKGQLRHQNFLPLLKAKSEQYFPLIVPILKQYQIPEDFKYLPVVESGFTNATSPVGAQGVWQFMPGTAAELGLVVADGYDERNHLLKATQAACVLLRKLYVQLQSWTLAAAAYNAGAGNISRNIRKQGSKDYYQLMLNNETAQYIYKIIAVKQLFESPELYLPGFGYNVFNKNADNASVFATGPNADNDLAFKSIRINVGKKLAKAPALAYTARLHNSASFTDGQLVSVQLLDDLQADGVYISKNTNISGRGWLVSNRVYVDLGFGTTLVLCDSNGNKGVPLTQLKEGGTVKLIKST